MGTCGYGVFIGNQNQYVDIPHNQQLSFSERLTVSAWVYPVSRPTGDGLHTIVAKMTTTSSTWIVKDESTGIGPRVIIMLIH